MDRYEPLREIGTNHYATLWEGNDFQMERGVAIMALHDRFLRNPRIAEQVWQDIKSMSEIRDRNIVPVYDIVPDRGWVVMELMRGSLGQRLQTSAILPDLARSVMRQVLEALVKIHSSGKLHGDVKPNNILFNDEGRVLLSFSPGLYLAGSVPHRQNDQKYQAPELLKTDAFGPVGCGADLYCLGFSILELLKGPGFDSLFRGAGTDPKTAWARWHGDPDQQLPAARDVVPNLPIDLARVIDGLLKKKVAERYPSAEAVLRDLDDLPLQLVNVEPEVAPPPPTEPRVRTTVSFEGESPFGTTPNSAAQTSVSRATTAPAKPTTGRHRQPSTPGRVPSGTPLKPWSRDWINRKLENPWMMATVIALLLIPVALVFWAQFQSSEGNSGGGGGGENPVVVAGGDEASHDESAKKDSASTKSDGSENKGDENGSGAAANESISPPAPKFHEITIRVGPADLSNVKIRIDGQDHPVEQQTATIRLPLDNAEQAEAEEVVIEASADGHEPFKGRRPRSQLLQASRLSIPLRPVQTAEDLARQEATAFVAAGRRHLEEQQYDAAIEAFNRALALVQDFPGAHLLRGQAEAALRKFDVAIADFREAIRLAPDDVMAYLQLGHALFDSNRPREAIAAYEQTLTRSSELVAAWTGRAAAHIQLQEYDKAYEVALEAEKHDPANAVVFNQQGAALVGQSKDAEALAAFDKAIELDADNADALVNRGRLYYRMVDAAETEFEAADLFGKSIADLSRAIELRPVSPSIYNSRGLSYSSSGRFSEAISDFDSAISLNPEYATAFYNRSLAYKAIGQLQKSKADRERAFELAPSLRSLN